MPYIIKINNKYYNSNNNKKKSETDIKPAATEKNNKNYFATNYPTPKVCQRVPIVDTVEVNSPKFTQKLQLKLFFLRAA